jgi:cytochrome c-type biogenesis protein CcsB
VLITQLSEHYLKGVGVGRGTSPLQYALSQPGVILHYLRLAFWPAGQCLDYGWPVAHGFRAIVPPLIALLALLAITLWCMVRHPMLGFVCGGFFLILGPTSSVLPLADLAFEHRMYLPLASVCVQVVLGMYFRPQQWQHEPMIHITGKMLPGILGISGRSASYASFFDPDNHFEYRLKKYVNDAYRKSPADRSKLDQDIIKLDERLNVCYLIYSGRMFRIFPVSDDPGHRWYSPAEAAQKVPYDDSLFVSSVLHRWYAAATTPGEEEHAAEILGKLKAYQTSHGGDLIPPPGKIKMEVLYERYDIFGKLAPWYGLFGFILVIILFFRIVRQAPAQGRFVKLFTIPLLLGFLGHTAGLAIRWYVSGHAPWSNGYESMIYIAWAGMLAGLVFARKSPFALAAAAILSALTLFVAHLSWMNPEITNLVPVLKSYWLTLHVSIITASYGFLGLGMIIGLLNLLLYIMKTEKNRVHISRQQEVLSQVNEMALILGLYFLTVGTFLGGVWANESWGRYWGWDPKETWALITVVVYAFVVHMRFIPGLRGYFAFNVASVLAFFSVIMTYFGVNYYLTGLHSYAGGDTMPVPPLVFWLLGGLAALIALAWWKEKRVEGLKGR